ncbi:MAG: ATP-binding protein [Pseudobdellovibrionaceae bacterium]
MTKLFSLCRIEDQLKTVEVEVSLTPGLPSIQVLGLPDQHLKESAARIKSALRAQGFEFPQARGILVNLRPSHFRKTSKGLELAIAAGVLRETGQMEFSSENSIFYGELSLYGDVGQPEDLEDFSGDGSLVVTTGKTKFPIYGMNLLSIETLRDLEQPKPILGETHWPYQRPQFGLDFQFPKYQGRFLEIAAVGGFHVMLAGPSGSGKTTIGQFLHTLSTEFTWEDIRRSGPGARPAWNEQKWRPLVRPHHTTPTASLLGGGSHPWMGEVAKSNGGVLLMDEFLEFAPAFQEALREPMEEQKIRISRSGKYREFPFRSQIVATTNLCPCGDWTPEKIVRCRYSIRKCQSTLSRLSGPVVDRFEMLAFMKSAPLEPRISGESILEGVERCRIWISENPKRDLSAQNLLILLPSTMASQRRRKSTLRVARAIADLDKSLEIQRKHLLEALEYTFFPFEKLKTGFP